MIEKEIKGRRRIKEEIGLKKEKKKKEGNRKVQERKKEKIG